VNAREIRVYPNPAKDFVQFEVQRSTLPAGRQGSVIGVFELHLFDVFGRQVAGKEITTEQSILDVSGLPEGFYIYKVVLGEITYSGKLVIQR
jgi:hypothetical protein